MPANGCTRDPTIDVTLTTAPAPALNSSNSPRASRIGARKLTWNTVIHVSTGVVNDPSRDPSGALGEIPALLTKRMQWAAVEACLDLADRPRHRFAVAEVDLHVILGTGIPRAQRSARTDGASR